MTPKTSVHHLNKINTAFKFKNNFKSLSRLNLTREKFMLLNNLNKN